MVIAVKRPAGETRGKVAAGPHAGQCHRASPRPYHVLRNLLSMAGERAGRPLLMPATDGYGTATAHAIAGDGTWSRYPCVRAVDGR